MNRTRSQESGVGRQESETGIAVGRRGFLRTTAVVAGGLVVGFYLPETESAEAAVTPAKLNAYVYVGSDDSVRLMIHKAEMGQGTVTSISMLLAEELECDWRKIKTEFAPVNREFGPNQGVYGSSSIRTSWGPLRQAGAAAREMLVQAAAQKWGVDKTKCRAENNSVINTASGEKTSYGSLAEAAAKLQAPANVTLKDPSQYKVIGKATKRLDTPSKVDGSAQFGLDMRLPGMLYAVIARCPVFGGKVASFDAAQAKSVPGVQHVVAVSTGVAVVADNTWTAMEGRRKLQVKFDEGPVAAHSTPGITKSFIDAVAQGGGTSLRKDGDSAAALASAAKKLEAVYEVPYLAHAPMEPLNCTAWVKADSCEIWASTQGQSAARGAGVQVTGLPPEKVEVHTLYMGGGFGRRAREDYMREAVEISKAVNAPVKLTWTREDDMQHDAYRPASYCKFAGGLDAEGWPVVWTTAVACPQFGGPATSVEGIHNGPYTLPNMQVDYHNIDPGVPVSYWRSVGYSQNVFFGESFIDEMAHAGGKDPLEVRRRMLAKNPRALAALELVAEKAGWGKQLPAGHGRGISIANNIGSITAQIAEVSVEKGKLKIHRVVCAVDCGQVINPAGVTQQIESGIAFGLSAALKGGITIKNGRVEQGNFHDYDVLRIDEMPKVEVHLVASHAAPGGIGEASTPGIAPAVTNGLFAATGKRIRRLPMKMGDLA